MAHLDERPPEDSEEYCGEPLVSRPGTYCAHSPTKPDGKCGHHSKHSKKQGPPKGTVNNMKHGLYAGRSNFYKSLSEPNKQWLLSIYHSFLDDAPFGEDAKGKCEILWHVCCDILKQHLANDYINDQGIVQQKTAGVTEAGPIKEPEENVLFITQDRLARSTIKRLKELGILDDAENRKAEAQESFIDFLSQEFDEEE